jgi:hypothetical protein
MIAQPEAIVFIYEDLEVGEILEASDYFFDRICCCDRHLRCMRRYMARYLSLLLDTAPHESYYTAKTRSASKQASFTVATR